MFLSEAIKLLFIYFRSQGYKPGTLLHYTHTLGKFQKFCETQGVKDVEAVNHLLVREYWVELKEKGYAVGGYARDLRKLFNFLVGEELIEARQNPIPKAGIPKSKDKQVKAIPPSAIEKLLEAAAKGRNPWRDRALLLLLLDSGARVGEVLGLHIGDLNFETRSVPIRGKGDRDRSLFWGYRTTRFLIGYIQKERKALPDVLTLFVNDEGEPMPYTTVRMLLERLHRRAGLPNHVEVSAHKLRHSFATQFLAAGGSTLALQRLLGHSTLEMTRRYAQIADEQLAIEHAKASPADRLLGRMQERKT